MPETKHEKWLQERRKGLGGSDASAIIGMNPWKTSIDVWEDKVLGKSEDISNMEAIKYGKKAEKHLTNLFKLDYPQYSVKCKPYEIRRHPKYDFIIGSLDGELTEKSTGRKGVLEIKTTKILNSMHREKWSERIPDNYYIQVIWYMLVTGYDFAILKAQLKTELSDGEIYLQTKHYQIERSDVEEDISYLLEEGVKFWNNYVIPKIKAPLVLPNI